MSGRRGPPMERSSRPYKVLCVSSLHPKASDDVVRDTLYREFKKYGDISVRVVLDPDGRVAYVYFRNFDDARDARHSKSRIILYTKIINKLWSNNLAGSYVHSLCMCNNMNKKQKLYKQKTSLRCTISFSLQYHLQQIVVLHLTMNMMVMIISLLTKI